MRSDYQLPSTYARTPFGAGIICRFLVGAMLVAYAVRVVAEVMFGA